MSDKLSLSDFEIQMLLIERNTCHYRTEQIDELLNKIGAAKGLQDSQKTPEKTAKPSGPSPVTVQEIAFTMLKWDPQQSDKIGTYETAAKATNDSTKWSAAHDILNEAKASIKDRLHGASYQYAYWLFGQDKIYRQKLKA